MKVSLAEGGISHVYPPGEKMCFVVSTRYVKTSKVEGWGGPTFKLRFK